MLITHRAFQNQTRLLRLWVLVAFLSVVFIPQAHVQAEPLDPNNPDATIRKVFLPITVLNSPVRNVMLGIYPSNYWQPMVQDAINKEFIPLDTWSGKHLSLAGVFHSIDQYKTVSNMLPTIWNNGYTPFVNIYFNASAYTIASGGKDAAIRAWARDFAIYANGGTRMAFLAPMQEMNGDWVPYGLDPANFKIAFKRIRQLFSEEGVPSASVRWVFAPNGYSDSSDPGFETYYPGDAYVDVVAFSGYNFGYHPLNPYKDWETPSEVFSPYLTRMTAMAPSKPIMVVQTGTTAYYNSSRTTSPDQKNLWLREAYTLLAQYPGVIGVIYYDDSPDYDWTFYRSGSVSFTGYREGVASASFVYIPPVEVMEMELSQP
jgi:hypothetical protein